MTTPQSMRERIIDHCDLRDYGLDEAEVQSLAADIEDLLAAAREEERERFPTTMPRSVSISIVANDGVEQEAIRKVLTLEQISRSSGVLLKHVTEDAIRAIVQSKIITQTIGTPSDYPAKPTEV